MQSFQFAFSRPMSMTRKGPVLWVLTRFLSLHWRKWFRAKVLPPIWQAMMKLLSVQQVSGEDRMSKHFHNVYTWTCTIQLKLWTWISMTWCFSTKKFCYLFLDLLDCTCFVSNTYKQKYKILCQFFFVKLVQTFMISQYLSTEF